MVAISLYRGNLHKVSSNVPRQWLMPPPKISLKDFRILLRRRHRALSRIAAANPSHNFNGLDKNQHKDEIFEEIGKIDDEGRELEVLELVEEGKDGILEGIGKNDFEGKGLEVLKLGGEDKDGIFEGIGEGGCEGEGLEVVKLGEEGKDGILEDFEGKGLEVSKLVEEGVEKEKGDGKDEIENGGGVEKLVEGTGSLVVKGKRGDEGNAGGMGITASGLDCDNGVRIDQRVETKVEGLDVVNRSLEVPNIYSSVYVSKIEFFWLVV